MTLAHLPEVGRLADELTDEILDSDAGERARWGVIGNQTAGKSTLLRVLAGKLLAQGLFPVTVAPPVKALDSGPIGLLQLVGALRDQGVVDGQVGSVLDPGRSWSEKLEGTLDWLEKDRDRIVLLCDEPLMWIPDAVEESYFSDGTWSLIATLVDRAPCRVVIAGKLPEGRSVRRSHFLAQKSDPIRWLSDPSHWGELTAAAERLRESMGEDLGEYTPLEIRLMVGHVAVADAMGLEPWYPDDTDIRREISRRFGDLLAGHPRWLTLRLMWARLALVRRPFEEGLLRHLGDSHLDLLGTDILRRCLLYGDSDRWVLHEMLRTDARKTDWLGAEEGQQTHGALATYYRTRTEGEPSAACLLDYEAEAFHHAIESHDSLAFEHHKVYFVRQLDAMGRVLSHKFRDYRAAVNVFERSLEWETASPYAHHYLAYNLDCLADQPQRVEPHYKEAIRLDPTHPWWHSRWIGFLLAQSRVHESHKAWDNALDSLTAPERRRDPRIYLDLHRWVAAVLLRRGEIDFAAEVLDDVPTSVRESDSSLQALVRRIEALREVETHGALVPASLILQYPRWWQEGPFLLHDELDEGHRLTRWLAGRIETVELGEFGLRVADIRPGQEDFPEIRWMRLPADRLADWVFDGNARPYRPGTFIEIGIYKGPRERSQTRILAHQMRRWQDFQLPPIFPDPNRYVGRAGQEACGGGG